MTITDPNIAEGTATVFTWLADKVLGGAKKAFGWGWEHARWASAQDRYDEQIIKQYGSIRIFGQTTPKLLREVFTDVYMLDKPTAISRFDPDALRRHLWGQDRGTPFRFDERSPADQLLERGSKFFILGKPGAGKTTFLKHLAVREAQRGKWGRCLGKIPIFVPLKQFAESGKSLFDFIVGQFAVCHFPDAAPFVGPLLKEGKALVLFDGLDEVTKDGNVPANRRGQVAGLIEQFSRQYDGCHVAITCRIAATDYTFDPSFIYLEVADFAPDQVDAFVRNWFWDPAEPTQSAGQAERMLTELKQPEHKGILDLSRNPLLLTLLCLNYTETQRFPARRVEIYHEALDALLKKWDSSREIQRSILYRTLSLGRKQQMFSRIAYDGFLQDEILYAKADLVARLKAYLTHVPEVPDAIDIDAEAVLAEIVEQHGIFSEQAHSLFSFAHLTFQEFYVAKYLAENPAADALDRSMARVTDPQWREVFLLCASQMQDATPFLAAFEIALHQVLAIRPTLVAYLRWVAERAALSQAGYRGAATRAFFIIVQNPYPKRIDAAGFVAARPNSLRELVPNLDLDLALALNLDFALLSGSLTYSRQVFSNSPAYQLQEAQRISQRQGKETLARALSLLVIPSADASPETFHQFTTQLEEAIEAYGEFHHYRQLESEIWALSEASGERPVLDGQDEEILFAYIDATRLFYDCLQLAYTPNRRAFEDRILLPPLLTEQET